MNELGNDRIMVLRVKLLDDTYVYIIGVYLPTTSEPADTFNYHLKLLEDVSLELSNNGSIIILGDLNAHIGQLAGERSFTKINSRGRCVHRLLDDLDLISVNSQNMCKGPVETFYGNQGFIRTTIDHIFVPREFSIFIAECAVIEDCSANLSYHLPIYCDLQVIMKMKQPQCYKKLLMWDKLKGNIYVKRCQDEIERGLSGCSWTDQSLDSFAKIENYVEKITHNLKSAALSSVPIKKPKPFLKRCWNINLSALNKKVKLSRKTWLRNGKPRGWNYQCFMEYKNAKRDFHKAQRRAIYDEEVKDLEQLEKEHDIDRSDFFRKISRITEQPQNTNDALLMDGKRIDDEDELLSIWREHYEDLYTPKHDPDFDENFKMHVEESPHNIEEESYGNEDPLDIPFKVEEIQSVCDKLPNGKAGGLDQLVYEHFKYGGSLMHQALTRIFNAVRQIEYVAESWTLGNIFSILKKGKKNKLDKRSYGGITLLNVMGKIFECILLHRWIPKFKAMGIPNNFQFAYQKNKSCVLSSFFLQEIINHNVEKGSKVYCCFLDSSKAFDSVWLDGLFYKLYHLGFNGKSWRILRNWYGKMRCCVSVNSLQSNMFPVKQGVRQGGVLLPWLYLCFNNDIPEILKPIDSGLKVHNIHCNSVLVADHLIVTQGKGTVRLTKCN